MEKRTKAWLSSWNARLATKIDAHPSGIEIGETSIILPPVPATKAAYGGQGLTDTVISKWQSAPDMRNLFVTNASYQAMQLSIELQGTVISCEPSWKRDYFVTGSYDKDLHFLWAARVQQEKREKEYAAALQAPAAAMRKVIMPPGVPQPAA
jgi:hypothetical protein